MPELPEVEIMTRALRRQLRGQRLCRVDICDPKIRLNGSLVGCLVQTVSRRGKYIILGLDNGRHLLVHLRMTGWFEFKAPSKYRCALHTKRATAYFVDSRRFGQMRLLSAKGLQAAVEKLGPEPLNGKFDASCLRRTRRPVKIALLDQHLVAGVGNIYASESLWRARIDPCRPAHRLTGGELHRLHRGLVMAMRKALRYGTRIYQVQEFEAYDREGRPCRRCRQPIRRIIQQQRSTFYCPRCQSR
jgi:formamidopyrimidine-DNA glycosylase